MHVRCLSCPLLWSLILFLPGCNTLFTRATVDAGSDAGGADIGGGGDVGETVWLCTDDCLGGVYAGDGDCDDGGPDALFSVCVYGTDCEDCGRRDAAACEPRCGQPGNEYSCGADGCGGLCGEPCPEGQQCMVSGATRACETCETCVGQGWECGTSTNCGEYCGDCGTGQYCDTITFTCQPCTCDGRDCGEDGCGASCGDCATGYCDQRPGHFNCDAVATDMCNNSCRFAGDRLCDDGGRGCIYADCAFGSDCADCGGTRTEADRLPLGTPCPG